MTRASKIISYFTGIALLIAAVAPDYVGHLGFGAPHSPNPDSAMAQGWYPDTLPEMESGDHHPGKERCEHVSHLACSSGHCCYLVPTAVLTEVKSDDLYNYFDAASSNLRDERLDPPPPRLSGSQG